MPPRLRLEALPDYPNDAAPLGIGTIQTLPPGSQATAAIRGTGPNQLLDLGLPQGADADASFIRRNYKIPALELVPAYIFGDSYGKNGSQNADPGTLGFDRFFLRNATVAPINNAASGTRSDQISAQIITSWTPNSRGIVGLADMVLNDVFQYGDTSGTATATEAFRTGLACLTAKAVGNIGAGGFVFGPGWTSGVPAANGAYVDFAWTGDSAYLLLGFTVAPGSLNIMNNGGTLLRSVSTGGFKQAFTGAVKLAGFGSGNHTVRLVSVTGNPTVVGAAIPSPNPPTVVWMKAGGLGRSTAEDLRILSYQTALSSILGDFPAVLQVGVDANWNFATMIGPDTIHPNDLGWAYWADRLMDVCGPMIGYRQGQNRLTAAGEPTYVPPTPAYAAAGATAPAQVTGFAATTANQVSFSWATPTDGGATINGFVIQSSPAGSGTWTTLGTAPAGSTSYSAASGLTGGTSYDFRIAATNAVGTGTYSATATATAGASATIYSADTFTRANNTNLGSSETGSYPWVQNNGSTSWSISSNQIVSASSSVLANDAYVDDGQSNGTISVKLGTGSNTTGNNTGLAFRMLGTNNVNGYIFWNNSGTYTLSKRTSLNGYTPLGTAPSITPAAGDVISVVLNGSSIICKVNGTTVITVTDGTYAGTRHGVWVNSGPLASFDNFSHSNLLT